MAGRNASRSEQLWYFALQLADEEAKSTPFAAEGHGQRIQAKYNQLVSNLSCVGDIIAAMYEKEKLTQKELEQIQNLQSTPIRANEELLSIIAKKPRDVYECFLSLVKDKKQLHLYQMLISGDGDSCDETKEEGTSAPKDLICRNFMWLSENLDTENGLITLLYQDDLLSVREKESISSIKSNIQKNESLLGLMSRKSPKDFDRFLKALEATNQGHIAKRFREREVSPSISTSKRINHKLPPKQPEKSYVKPAPRKTSVPPAKTSPETGQKVVPTRRLQAPVPPPKRGNQSASAQQQIKSMHTIATATKKIVNFPRTEERLKEFESHLKTDIAIKVTIGSLLHLDDLGDDLKMCLNTLLQDSHQMRNEIISRNVEINEELEQLRKSAKQYSAAAMLNESLRTNLNSMQQELKRERFQSSEKLKQMEQKLNTLKTDVHGEKAKQAKCKRLEEDKRKGNATIMEMEDRLKSAENKQLNLEKDAGAERERCLEKERSDAVDGGKALKHQTGPVDEISRENMRMIKLQEELENERRRAKELEDNLKHAKSQLEELNRKLTGREMTFFTQERETIKSNHQFLVENIDSSRLIDLLREENCITDEEHQLMSRSNVSVDRNDALLQWMTTVSFNEFKGQKVLDGFRQTEQNFVVELLQKGGVLVKTKILTKLEKKQKAARPLAKSSSKNAEELKEKEAALIEKLNQTHDWPQGQISISESANDMIFIAPYCRQEADGIVIWLWCQSKDGLRKLQKDYTSRSDFLLGRLIKIFKEFSNDCVSSESESVVPTGVTIFMVDFTKNESEYINGVAVLGQEVFISRLKCPTIEVYDSSAFRFKRRMEVKGMTDPEHIVSCFVHNCLYAFDWGFKKQPLPAILRIDSSDGKLIKSWNFYDQGGQISIASDTNVIINIYLKAKLHEYTADGEHIRTIIFGSGTGIIENWHAVKLPNGLFVVCHGGYHDSLSRVCLIATKASSPVQEKIDEGEILAAYGGVEKEWSEILTEPMYLSVDREGAILVSQNSSNRALLLSFNLDEPKALISARHGMDLPWKTCFDESTGQWILVDYHRLMVCRVIDKQVERKRYNLL